MTSQELNSTFDRFLAENNGKFVERVDPGSLNQCFDLAIYWCEYLGFPKSIFSGLINASQIYTQWTHTQFDKIPNTPEFVPQKGDICVFSGIPGHVSVATGKGDLNTFESFDQNFPTGSASHLVTHNYNNLLGVQRLKVTQDNMGDNIKRKSYFTDIMVQGVTEFWGGNVNTDNITETKWREYIAWIKDNVYRAGQYDLTKKEAGVTGNVPYGPVVAALRKQGSFNIEDFKKKVISFVQSL